MVSFQSHCYVRLTPDSKKQTITMTLLVALYPIILCIVSNYPDPLSGGVPIYHRRLSQMAALVSDTVQWEKDKAAKKSKKASSGAGTPRNGNNGSLGSL